MILNCDGIVAAKWAAEYWFGTVVARLILSNVGAGTRIHRSVRFVAPSRIAIGARCEMGPSSRIDGRSHREVAIRVDDECRIKDTVNIAAYGGSVIIGKRVLIGRCCTIFGHGTVNVGDDVMIGPGCSIMSTNHIATIGNTPFQAQGFTREEIVIQNNVWIGANVCVLAGAEVEPDVVVAAGSIVSGRLARGWIYGGSPATAIKRLPERIAPGIQVHYRGWGLIW